MLHLIIHGNGDHSEHDPPKKHVTRIVKSKGDVGVDLVLLSDLVFSPRGSGFAFSHKGFRFGQQWEECVSIKINIAKINAPHNAD